MASWDDDDYVPSLPAAALPTKTSWEDEEEDLALKPAPAPTPSAPAQPVVVKNKHIQKTKEAELRKKDELSAADAKRRLEDNTPLDDPVAEKARLERLAQAADMEAAADAFGLDSDGIAAAKARLVAGAGGSLRELVSAINLKETTDFRELADALSTKVHTASMADVKAQKGTKAFREESVKKAMIFYTELARLAAEKLGEFDRLGEHDLAELSSAFDRASKSKKPNAKDSKKQPAKKAIKINVGRADDVDDYYGDDFGSAPKAAAAAPAPAAAPATSATTFDAEADFM